VAYDEKSVGVHRLARPYHVVPPAFTFILSPIDTCDMVRGVQSMTNQYGIAFKLVQLSIGFKA
jgi:hypothetical protein